MRLTKNLASKLVPFAVIAVALIPASIGSAQDAMVADDAPTSISADDVVAKLRLYREPARQRDLLEVSIEQLQDLQGQIARSTEMNEAEKGRWTRAVSRRIGYLEDIAFRLERVEANQSPMAQSQSPGQQQNQQDIPTGWRRSRSWQGGGALPGGSWQGSEYQENDVHMAKHIHCSEDPT